MAKGIADGGWIDLEKAFATGGGCAPLAGFNTLTALGDVYLQELSFVPTEVREQLRAVCDGKDVDASWNLWSQEAEASLDGFGICRVDLTRLSSET